MDMDAIIDYISHTFKSTQIDEDSENRFFSYLPDPDIQLSGWTPFATLVANDAYDKHSQLNRHDVFRLNIGVKPETYRKLFGKQPPLREAEVVTARHDFAVLDQLMPHPIYAPMSWVCVLNPSETTFQAVKPLLGEAYRLAVRRHETGVKRRDTG